MSKLVYSLENPNPIKLDIVKNGSARLLCRWDIQTVEVGEEPHTEYTYQEEVIWWALPSSTHVQRIDGRQAITDVGSAYLVENASEIMEYAKAAGA